MLSSKKIISPCEICLEPFSHRASYPARACSMACVAILKVRIIAAKRRKLEVEYTKANPPPENARWVALAGEVFTLVDEDFYIEAIKILWNLSTRGYAFRSLPDQNIYLHHWVMGGPPAKGFLYDHINRDQLDNRRENLRVATKIQNAANTPIRKTNTSGFRGVKRLGKKWSAQVTCDGVRHHLGVFETPAEAALARDEVAKKLLGEFAQLNFPGEGN